MYVSILWLLWIHHMNYINLCFFVFAFACIFVYTTLMYVCMYLCKTSHLKNVTNKSYHFYTLPPFLRDFKMLERKWIFIFVFIRFFFLISLKAKISPKILKCTSAPFSNVKSFYYTLVTQLRLNMRNERGRHIIFMKTEYLLKRKTLAKYIHLICIVPLHTQHSIQLDSIHLKFVGLDSLVGWKLYWNTYIQINKKNSVNFLYRIYKMHVVESILEILWRKRGAIARGRI